jgi:hypothetical protein
MQTDLTLRIDQELVERAEAFSKKTGKSISELVAEYIKKLPEPPQEPATLTPIVSSLRGILRGSTVTEEDYRRYLEEKYR